eukprot:gene11158-21458_t
MLEDDDDGELFTGRAAATPAPRAAGSAAAAAPAAAAAAAPPPWSADGRSREELVDLATQLGVSRHHPRTRGNARLTRGELAAACEAEMRRRDGRA